MQNNQYEPTKAELAALDQEFMSAEKFVETFPDGDYKIEILSGRMKKFSKPNMPTDIVLSVYVKVFLGKDTCAKVNKNYRIGPDGWAERIKSFLEMFGLRPERLSELPGILSGLNGQLAIARFRTIEMAGKEIQVMDVLRRLDKSSERHDESAARLSEDAPDFSGQTNDDILW